MGPYIYKHKCERGVEGQKLKTKHNRSVSGCIMVLRSARGFNEVKEPLQQESRVVGT